MSLSGPHAARNLVKPTQEQLNSPRMYRVFVFLLLTSFLFCSSFSRSSRSSSSSPSSSSSMGIKSAVHNKGNALYAKFNFLAMR